MKLLAHVTYLSSPAKTIDAGFITDDTDLFRTASVVYVSKLIRLARACSCANLSNAALSNPANFRNSVLLQTLAISADCETSKTGLSVSLTL